MAIADNIQTTIIKHIEGLTPDMVQEVIDFIDFLKTKKADKMHSNIGGLLLQQKSLGRIWDSESEELYEL